MNTDYGRVPSLIYVSCLPLLSLILNIKSNDYTDLISAAPYVSFVSFHFLRFAGLMERRRPFVESLRPYGDSLLLLPAFSYGPNTPVSLRAVYALEDFGVVRLRPMFFNPEYLSSLAHFWRRQGLRSARLSTGLIVASLALELCANVHLYGFWPFSLHPHSRHSITNHYYDDRQSKKNVHSMPTEFEHLLRLHMQGVVRLHLGECSTTQPSWTDSFEEALAPLIIMSKKATK